MHKIFSTERFGWDSAVWRHVLLYKCDMYSLDSGCVLLNGALAGAELAGVVQTQYGAVQNLSSVDF